MLDDLRNSANESYLFDEELDDSPAVDRPQRPRGHFLGMTPPQRFFLAVMLLLMTTLFGMLVLLVTEKIMLPM
ncbi:MAG: hypothetical protein GXY44_00870 [Phycisphaerales bacterium]|nr:hypothetical protein [Phycisphaerales bacterium]